MLCTENTKYAHKAHTIASLPLPISPLYHQTPTQFFRDTTPRKREEEAKKKHRGTAAWLGWLPSHQIFLLFVLSALKYVVYHFVGEIKVGARRRGMATAAAAAGTVTEQNNVDKRQRQRQRKR